MSTERQYTTKDVARFYSKVSTTPTEQGCLEWLAYHDDRGYGYFDVGGKPVGAHRVAWEIANGSIPAGMVIRHFVCDNPRCCNVAHLRLGTYADNVQDMMRSGRWKNAPNTTAPYVRPDKPTDEERFYSKISKTPTNTGCLDWLGRCNDDGYGTCMIGRDNWLAHRVAWMLANGPIPDGLCVLHRCDRPTCCRVEHLFLGTRTDNNQDRDEKGRHVSNPVRGEKCPWVKITEQDVIAIRSDIYRGWTLVAIAERFGISKGQVSRILRGEAWTHLDTQPCPPRKRGSVNGERNAHVKITEQDVLAIRSDLYRGWTLAAIGEQFGIGISQVSYILRRKSWTHI